MTNGIIQQVINKRKNLIKSATDSIKDHYDYMLINQAILEGLDTLQQELIENIKQSKPICPHGYNQYCECQKVFNYIEQLIGDNED